jgi:hypothetical protein
MTPLETFFFVFLVYAIYDWSKSFESISWWAQERKMSIELKCQSRDAFFGRFVFLRFRLSSTIDKKVLYRNSKKKNNKGFTVLSCWLSRNDDFLYAKSRRKKKIIKRRREERRITRNLEPSMDPLQLGSIVSHSQLPTRHNRHAV